MKQKELKQVEVAKAENEKEWFTLVLSKVCDWGKKTSKNPHLETDLWKVIQFHEGEKNSKQILGPKLREKFCHI